MQSLIVIIVFSLSVFTLKILEKIIKAMNKNEDYAKLVTPTYQKKICKV